MAFNIVFSCVVFVIVWLCFDINLLTDSAVEIYLYGYRQNNLSSYVRSHKAVLLFIDCFDWVGSGLCVFNII